VKVLIFGAGENGVQAYHILKRAATHEIVAFVDDDVRKKGSELCGVPVFAGQAKLAALREQGVEGAIAAIGDNELRLRVTDRLHDCGYRIINAIHPLAMIDETAEFGVGVIVEMGVAIHPLARIGDCVFLGGSCVISHHSVVERGALIAGGVIFGGHVHVGAGALIGVGAVLQPHIRIGSGTVVGVGAAVVSDLPDNVVAVGVPAKVIRHRGETNSTAQGRG
jgi:sugar O-acyltransferase (sialic acid O-acetyltransferase NeuD family)